MSYTTVGVIGHIDHGKTSLVAALTGIDTDTHPEEKQRGITIDLGFASLTDDEHTFAFIDAPGHQKYIGNLLAGVSAIDLGLLVVAADQGIQAQTLEHAAILQGLGVDRLIAVISRIDLANANQLAELPEELDLFLAEYGFESVPKIPVSTVTGAGLDELKSLLMASARLHPRVAPSDFRMPIDRVFTIEGRGCVVAGTPWSGQVASGDSLELAGRERTVRVRELESHGHAVEKTELGVRTAINIVGASAQEISRGDELVTPGTHPLGHRFLAELTLLADVPRLKCPAEVQLHTATTCCEATLSGVRHVEPGEPAVVVIDCHSPLIGVPDQRCLIRRPYPVGSIAAARILAAVERERARRRDLLSLGTELRDADQAGRLIAWTKFQGELGLDADRLERLGVDKPQQGTAIQAASEQPELDDSIPEHLVSRSHLQNTKDAIKKLLAEQAEKSDNAWLDEAAVSQRVRKIASPPVITEAIERMIADKQIVRVNQLLAIASEQTVLSKKQRSDLQQMMNLLADTPTPPTAKELAAEIGTTLEATQSLLRFAASQGTLLEFGNGFYMSATVFGSICEQLRELFRESPARTVAEIRDALGITRKHAIPLLEYCDSIGVTRRDGDCRAAGNKLAELVPPSSAGEPEHEHR